MNAPTVAVVGAGIGGLTAAIALRAKGIDVEIYEAAPGPRATGTALGIASNATKVLRSLGIDLTTDASCRALEHFELRTARGALIRALPGAAITAELGHPFVSIHRNELIRTLRNAAADTPIHYGAEVVDVGIERCGARAACVDGTDVRAGVLDRRRRIPIGRPVDGRRGPSAQRVWVRLLACHRALYTPMHGARIYRPLLGQGTAVRAHRHRRRDGLLVGNKEHARRQGT